MSIAIGGIDHAIIGVHELEPALQTYRRLGFTLSPRGRHIGRGTANYCIMFEQDYLELRGIVDANQFVAGLDKFLEAGEGAAGLVFSTGNAEDCREVLMQAGISMLAQANVQPQIALRLLG